MTPRIAVADVREAYEGLGVAPSRGSHVEFAGRELVAAGPAFVVAAYWQGVPPERLERAAASRQDPGGAAALAGWLGLDADYLRGLADGWAGAVPAFDSEAEWAGWLDGSKLHAVLFGHA